MLSGKGHELPSTLLNPSNAGRADGIDANVEPGPHVLDSAVESGTAT